MKRKLLVQACTKFFAGLVTVGLLLFVSAGTLSYWKGWLFMMALFIPMLLAGIVLWVKSPNLLAKRLNATETEPEQKRVIMVSSFMMVGGLVVAGLDFRLGWTSLPDWLSAAATAVFLVSYGLYAEVMRENAYLSRTVQVQEGQKVVDTGLYGMVRHPMYFATLFLFLSIPVILGSVYAWIVFLMYPFLLVKRIKNEEAVLVKGLAGYEDYRKKVKYRLLPFIW